MKAELTLHLESAEIATDWGCVLLALRDAERKHPNWPSDNIFEQISILTEEVGEMAMAANDLKHGKATIHDLRNEAYQAAAVCFRILKNLEKTGFLKDNI